MAKPSVTFTMQNRRTSIRCDQDAMARLKHMFRWQPKGYEHMPKYKTGEWDGWLNAVKWGGLPTGLFLDARDQVEQAFDARIIDKREALTFAPHTVELRPYQQEALKAMQDASATGGLILSATGTGKTRIACAFCASARGSVCFVVDELTLLQQTRDAFGALGLSAGIVGRGEFRPERVTIATIQTLALHRDDPAFKRWFGTLDVLIIDELHVAMARRNFDVVRQIQPKAVYGLTATLELDKPYVRFPAVSLAGPVIYRYPLVRGQEDGYLASGKVIKVVVRQESHIRDSRVAYMEHVVRSTVRNGAVVALVQEGLRRGRKIAVLVRRREHLQLLSRMFAALELRHRVMSGAQDVEERRRAQAEMEAGTLELILTNQVFAKGVDIPILDCTVDATGAPSANDAIQRLGRGTRKREGKGGFVHLDISDAGIGGMWKLWEAAIAREAAFHNAGVLVEQIEWKENAKIVWEAVG